MKKSLGTLAVLSLLVLPTGALADAYARAYNQVSNFVITPSDGWVIVGNLDHSSAAACLDGNCVQTGGDGSSDAPVAQIGLPDYAANSYLSHLGATASYAVGDSSIDADQLHGAPFTSARNLAEATVHANGNASASSGNASATSMSSQVIIGQQGGIINFRFDATPYLSTGLTSNAGVGSLAVATMEFTFSVVDSVGNTVFQWAPDGQAGGIFGGIETADAFTLNTSMRASASEPMPQRYHPADCALGSVGTGCFNASTDALIPGLYTLTQTMHEAITLTSVIAAVPEPDGYAMLLAGIVLMALLRRRASRRRNGPARSCRPC